MKKSKWILNLTLSIVTMMLAAEVLAKGGGHPGSPAGTGRNWHFVDVTPKWNARVASRHHFAAMSPQAPRPGSPRWNDPEARKKKREQKRQQCIDTCKENFGEFYKWADKIGWLGVGGALTSAGMSLLQNKTRTKLKREGLRRIHDPDPRKYKSGRFLLSWSNVIKGFGKLSFKVGLLASAGQASMWSYCKYYKCGKSQKG